MLKEIKCFQPARTGIFGHDARYCYQVATVIDCSRDGDNNRVQYLRLVGAEGEFKFVDGQCPNWQGQYQATIVGDVPYSERMRPDRFENL